jgi:hypothetical protein
VSAEGIEFVEKTEVPTKPGAYQHVLFQEFEKLTHAPTKALRVDLTVAKVPKATLYYILRKWNATHPKFTLHYTLQDARTRPVAFIYIVEEVKLKK